MRYKLNRSYHLIYALQYHLVQYVKCERKILIMKKLDF